MTYSMMVYGFTLDQDLNMPVAILKDEEGNNSLPIWISTEEAISMAVEIITRDIFARSGGQDLMGRILESVALQVSGIRIDDVNDGVLSASITLDKAGEHSSIAVKPAEAMLLSLRYRLPIVVPHDVVGRAAENQAVNVQGGSKEDARAYLEFLENLTPDKLGKYPM